MTRPSFGLFTSARDEELYIGSTIESVAAQRVLPRRWIIASDSSTDGTDRIIRDYARRLSFIRYLRLNGGGRRDFRSKARALNTAAGLLAGERLAFLGNLDADISVGRDYYESVLRRFRDNPRLGIAGGIVRERIDGRYVPQNISLNSVAGGVQMFRAQCFAQVSPYTPMRFGGEDAVLEITARWLGWEVETFTDLPVLHHRPVGASFGGRVRARYRMGQVLRSLGYHPLFEALRCLRRLTDRPLFLASLAEMAGYLRALAQGINIELPPKLVEYLRQEQLARVGMGFLAGR